LLLNVLDGKNKMHIRGGEPPYYCGELVCACRIPSGEIGANNVIQAQNTLWKGSQHICSCDATPPACFFTHNY